ncbi:unknown [Prevotella sp. CAG:487]|nr:unknown [Prevotella sp. CAG:487]
MNFMMVPSCRSPKSSRNTPAMSVAMVSPCMPYCCIIPYIITMKAPVGPPICTLLPPAIEMMKPATMAVMMPFSGVTPEAMPKAMASGRATMPTITPAMTSAMKVFRL